jgi:hypothetical protein
VSANTVEWDNGPTLTSCSIVFAKIALVPFLCGIAVLAYAALAPGSDVGVLTADACLLITVALVTLLVPVITMVVYYAIVIPLLLALILAAEDVPLPGWAARLRTVARYMIIVTSFVVIAVTIPRLFLSPTWKDFKETALVGVIAPVLAIAWLFSSRVDGMGLTETPDEPAR